ncbi:amidohydrolase [Clostridiaceae bacterium NSJ-31]|uniref:Amidohydrolase n=1 Tax=Ligaoa zhengdingensis TaxID=2763658 RepID=A0A926DWU0_9FIRM|nr:amidohydrolase [Ligaoa zhengdingensis]MBC8545338.1 amidohydrolase [Ligaoa zhengdingensis]
MVIINGKIVTMAGPTIEKGYIRTQGTKIAEVGPMEEYQPAQGEEVIEAAGAGVYPGFVDAHCHIGMWEDSMGFEGDDGNEDTDPCTPHLRALDAINPTERCFSEALAGGVTTVVVAPGSANPIAGQVCAMKTRGCCVDDMLLRENIAVKLALGENPKITYHAKGQAPTTRMATAALIREQLAKTRRYLEDKEAAAEDEELDEPELDFKCEALIPLLKREVKAHIHAHRADDICTAVRICEEFDLDYLLIHCTDGYKLTERLAARGAGAVTGPLIGSRTKPELAGQALENPGLLSKAGVKTAICTDHPEVPIQYLALSAGIAVRGGMDYDEALKAITIYPAELCGIADRVGSIEPGKDADLVFFFGDPLSVYAKPKLVIVNGECK